MGTLLTAGGRGRVTNLTLWILLILGLAILLRFPLDYAFILYQGDFPVFYGAGRTSVSGALPVPSFYDAQAFGAEMTALLPGVRAQPWVYPPPMLLLTAPLGLFGPVAAYALWGGLLLGCTAWAAWLAGLRGLPLAALSLSPTSLFIVGYGQTDAFFLLLLAAGFAGLQRRPLLAGLALGCLALKPQLAAPSLLALLAARRWAPWAGALAAGAGLLLASLLAFGLAPWPAFLEAAPAYADNIRVGLVSWDGLISPYAFFRSLALGHGAALALHGLVAMTAFAATLLRFKGRIGSAEARGALVALGLLAAPYITLLAYLLLLLPAALLMCQRPGDRRLPALLAIHGLFPAVNMALIKYSGLSLGACLTLIYLALLLLPSRDADQPG